MPTNSNDSAAEDVDDQRKSRFLSGCGVVGLILFVGQCVFIDEIFKPYIVFDHIGECQVLANDEELRLFGAG
jgi:hypothetical protein